MVEYLDSTFNIIVIVIGVVIFIEFFTWIVFKTIFSTYFSSREEYEKRKRRQTNENLSTFKNR